MKGLSLENQNAPLANYSCKDVSCNEAGRVVSRTFVNRLVRFGLGLMIGAGFHLVGMEVQADGGIFTGDGYPRDSVSYTVSKTLPGDPNLENELRVLLKSISINLPSVGFYLNSLLSEFKNPSNFKYNFILSHQSLSGEWSSFRRSVDESQSYLPQEAQIVFSSDFGSLPLRSDKMNEPSQVKALLHELVHIGLTKDNEFGTRFVTENLYTLGLDPKREDLLVPTVTFSASIEHRLKAISGTNAGDPSSRETLEVLSRKMKWFDQIQGLGFCSLVETYEIQVMDRVLQAPRAKAELKKKIQLGVDPFFDQYLLFCVPFTGPDSIHFSLNRYKYYPPQVREGFKGTGEAVPIFRNPDFVLSLLTDSGRSPLELALVGITNDPLRTAKFVVFQEPNFFSKKLSPYLLLDYDSSDWMKLEIPGLSSYVSVLQEVYGSLEGMILPWIGGYSTWDSPTLRYLKLPMPKADFVAQEVPSVLAHILLDRLFSTEWRPLAEAARTMEFYRLLPKNILGAPASTECRKVFDSAKDEARLECRTASTAGIGDKASAEVSGSRVVMSFGPVPLSKLNLHRSVNKLEEMRASFQKAYAEAKF